jgi:hypothetical protein
MSPSPLRQPDPVRPLICRGATNEFRRRRTCRG